MLGRMVRSRSFAGTSLLTAAALCVSSVTVAGPLPPVSPGDLVQDRLVHRIDNRRAKRERLHWERRYDDHRGSGRRAAPRKQDYRGANRMPTPRQSRRAPTHEGRSPPRSVIVVKPPRPAARVVVPPNRRHRYRDVWVVRPYGHWYGGYGHHYHDHDAYPWLAFTAITLSLLALLTVAQQRAHEQAQIDATAAPVGSTIVWNDANASGAVSVLRDGHSSNGQYCREFLQTVTVAGRSEQAYGIACMKPDGSWRIVDTQ